MQSILLFMYHKCSFLSFIDLFGTLRGIQPSLAGRLCSVSPKATRAQRRALTRVFVKAKPCRNLAP